MRQTQLPEDIRKAIEQEAEKLYPVLNADTNVVHDDEQLNLAIAINDNHWIARKGYTTAAEKYFSACIQKDEEIQRLRYALEGLVADVKNGRDWTRHETALCIATEALKQQ